MVVKFDEPGPNASEVCHRLALIEGQKENGKEIKECKVTDKKLALKNEKFQNRPLGVILTVCLNIIFGLAALMLGAIYVTVILFISSIGLWQLKLWAWCFTVSMIICSLLLHIWIPFRGFPLEVITLVYLVIKRKNFGVRL